MNKNDSNSETPTIVWSLECTWLFLPQFEVLSSCEAAQVFRKLMEWQLKYRTWSLDLLCFCAFCFSFFCLNFSTSSHNHSCRCRCVVFFFFFKKKNSVSAWIPCCTITGNCQPIHIAIYCKEGNLFKYLFFFKVLDRNMLYLMHCWVNILFKLLFFNMFIITAAMWPIWWDSVFFLAFFFSFFSETMQLQNHKWRMSEVFSIINALHL